MVVNDAGQGPRKIQRGEKSFYPEEVFSIILIKMKKITEACFEKTTTQAMVSLF
jgi:molecular chaperone DnaK (HSP70)